jgi:hypothetical protein
MPPNADGLEMTRFALPIGHYGHVIAVSDNEELSKAQNPCRCDRGGRGARHTGGCQFIGI